MSSPEIDEQTLIDAEAVRLQEQQVVAHEAEDVEAVEAAEIALDALSRDPHQYFTDEREKIVDGIFGAD